MLSARFPDERQYRRRAKKSGTGKGRLQREKADSSRPERRMLFPISEWAKFRL